MRQHKGFSLLELVVVIAISSLLLTVTGLGFNTLSNEAAKQQIADSQRTIGLIIAQLVSTGTTITTGYYTPASFQTAYGVALPGNPLNSSDPLQGQWYIQNESGTYNVYAAKDGSYIASTKYVVNNEFPYINNISKTVTVPTTTEYSSSAPIREKNLLYDGSFEKSGVGWDSIGITNRFTYNQYSVEEGTTGFFTSDWNVQAGSQIERVSTEKWEGNYSLRVTTNGERAYQGVSIRAAGNLPKGNYTFTVHLKAPAGTPMRIAIHDGATPGNVYPKPNVLFWTANGDWQEKSLSFYSAYDTTLLQCQVTLNNSTVATVFYLDGNRLDYQGNMYAKLSADAYKGDKSLMLEVNGINSSTLKQELSVSNLPLDRYYAVMHFKNMSADPAKTSVAFDFYYKTPTATVFSYTWNPTLSNYTWQGNIFISNVVGSQTGTVGIAVTVKGTATTAAGYVLIDDLGLYLLPGGE